MAIEKEYIEIEKKSVDESTLKLVYVNPVGESHTGAQVLEFIFSDVPDDAIGDHWEDECVYGVQPPKQRFIKKVLKIISKKIEFDTITESAEFRMLDASLGVVPLAWEYVEDYRKLPSLNKKLLVFRYGDSLYDIKIILDKSQIDYE